MSDKDIERRHHQTFENIRQVGRDGSEFWMARQLSKLLEYNEFRNFVPVIEKAKKSCLNSDQYVENHFVEMDEMVSIGSGAERKMASYAFSRYACYLIVQNGDPSKPVIANGQTYFAIQTRRQELADDAAFQRLKTFQNRLKTSGNWKNGRRRNWEGKAVISEKELAGVRVKMAEKMKEIQR